MRMRTVVIQVCLALALGIPQVAHAGIIELIDGWSGPGPFTGYGWEWRMACLSADGETPTQAEALAAQKDRKRPIGAVGPGCFFTPGALDPGKRRVASVNVGFGFYKSTGNPLFDGDTTTVRGDQVSTEVHLSSLDLAAWWRPARSFELGTGGGVLWINGEAFESFRRVYVRPVMVEVKPLAALYDFVNPNGKSWDSKDEILALRVGLHAIPAGFTAQDFGSTRRWQAVREVNPTIALFFDLGPLFKKHEQ